MIKINKNGSSLDIQKLLSKLPFKTRLYPAELHYVISPGNVSSYCGPGTNLQERCYPDCNENNLHPKEFSKEKNQVDQACHIHDHLYESSGEDLNKKHEADKVMLELLEKITPTTLSERMQKFIVSKIIGLKLKLGLGLEEDY